MSNGFDPSEVAIYTGEPVGPDFGAPPPASLGGGGLVEVESARAVQEVQAAMVVAKRFPRNEAASFSRVMSACKRKSLAEVAEYAYPRGGQMVTGPSIRLAEVLANAWGNIQYGMREISRSGGASEMEAFAWDLETNVRITRTFQVKHEREKKSGNVALTDSRDVYELTANQGSRRVRACILQVIPGDVVDEAVAQCKRTLSGNGAEPIEDRARRMVAAFAEHGVTLEMLERRIGHPIRAIVEPELAALRRIYTSLKDGVAAREEFFSLDTTQPAATHAEPAPEAPKPRRTRATTAPAPEPEPAPPAPSTEPPPELSGECPDSPGDHWTREECARRCNDLKRAGCPAWRMGA